MLGVRGPGGHSDSRARGGPRQRRGGTPTWRSKGLSTTPQPAPARSGGHALDQSPNRAPPRMAPRHAFVVRGCAKRIAKHRPLTFGLVRHFSPCAQPNSDKRNLPRAAVFLGGYCRFAAVTAKVFAASRRSWRRSSPLRGGHGGGLFTPTQKTTQKFASHATSAGLFFRRSLLAAWGLRLFAALAPPGEFFGEIVERKRKNKPKKATSTGRWRWSCGGLRRAALEVTAVFCGHGRWLLAAVFLGF